VAKGGEWFWREREMTISGTRRGRERRQQTSGDSRQAETADKRRQQTRVGRGARREGLVEKVNNKSTQEGEGIETRKNPASSMFI